MDNKEYILQCSKCKSVNVGKKSDETYFCRECGSTVRPVLAEAATPKCIECGSEDIGQKFEGGQFCRKCGADVHACKQCGGYDISKGYKCQLFCRSCGATGSALFDGGAESENSLLNSVSGFLEKNKETKKTGNNPKRGKFNLKTTIVTAAIVVVVVLCTFLFVNFNAPLEGKWLFGANTLTFNEDGTYDASIASLSYNGTFKVEGEKISLSYKWLGVMDKTTDWTYEIKGNELTITGDVTLTGAGSQTLTYECESNPNAWIKIVLILAEIVVGVGIYLIVLNKKTNNSIPQKQLLIESRCPFCNSNIEPNAEFCGDCGKRIK